MSAERLGPALMHVDRVAKPSRQTQPLHLGRNLAVFFELKFEPDRVHRLAVQPQVHWPTLDQIHVQDVVLPVLGNRQLVGRRSSRPIAHADILGLARLSFPVGDPAARPHTDRVDLALANLIQRMHPVAVVSYHSAAGIATGGVAAEASGMLAAYAANSGYPARHFVAYPVTGDFAQWCDDPGIPTVEVELGDHLDPELDRKLAGIQAALREIVARYPSYLGLE